MTRERQCKRCAASFDVRDGRCGSCGMRHYEIGQIVEAAPRPQLDVRPMFIDKLSHPRGTFNRGRKQTI